MRLKEYDTVTNWVVLEQHGTIGLSWAVGTQIIGKEIWGIFTWDLWTSRTYTIITRLKLLNVYVLLFLFSLCYFLSHWIVNIFLLIDFWSNCQRERWTKNLLFPLRLLEIDLRTYHVNLQVELWWNYPLFVLCKKARLICTSGARNVC